MRLGAKTPSVNTMASTPQTLLDVPTPGRVVNLDAAIAKHGKSRTQLYVEALNWGDPLADAYTLDCIAMGRAKGMRMLDDLLDQKVTIDELPDAPDSLRALMDQVETLPFWVDHDQIDAGAAAYSRYAREAGIALGTASLVSGYHNAAAARPLVVTGRFVDQAKLRALETSRWIFATARPGGLHRDGEGFKRTVRVRMIHAFVRHHILTRVDWDRDYYGVPINQADLAYTAVEFSYLPIRAMRRLGVHFSRKDSEGMYALWRYMSYLIGVDQRVSPVSEAECIRYNDLDMMISPPPDENCRRFVAALFDDVLAVDMKKANGLLGVIGQHWGRDLLHGLARDFVGDHIADGLGLDRTAWRFAPKVASPAIQISSRARALVPAWQRHKTRKALAEVDALLDEAAIEMGVKHDLVDQDAGHPASR